MKIDEVLNLLPNTKGAVVVLSGGLDSTIAMRFAVEKYGAQNVAAISFDYGQKQRIELEKAAQSTKYLGVKHRILDLKVLGEISKGFSANVDPDIEMPTIQEVIGNPRPATTVPNRNMIMMSIAAAFAEVQNIDIIILGLQATDQYNYADTTPIFIEKVNNVLSENRIIKIQVMAPFSMLSKTEELKLLFELDGDFKLASYTLTCYNPYENGYSCGKCPSCSERMKAFQNIGYKDPIPYHDSDLEDQQIIESLS